jgi:hypothetical protein
MVIEELVRISLMVKQWNCRIYSTKFEEMVANMLHMRRDKEFITAIRHVMTDLDMPYCNLHNRGTYRNVRLLIENKKTQTE